MAVTVREDVQIRPSTVDPSVLRLLIALIITEVTAVVKEILEKIQKYTCGTLLHELAAP